MGGDCSGVNLFKRGKVWTNISYTFIILLFSNAISFLHPFHLGSITSTSALTAKLLSFHIISRSYLHRVIEALIVVLILILINLQR